MNRGCLYGMGLGVGLAVGGAIVYGLATSETARLLALGTGMFVVGALIMALFLTYAVKAIAAGFGAQRHETTYNVLQPGERRGPGADWIMEGPRAEHLLPRLPSGANGGEVVGEDEEFVA